MGRKHVRWWKAVLVRVSTAVIKHHKCRHGLFHATAPSLRAPGTQHRILEAVLRQRFQRNAADSLALRGCSACFLTQPRGVWPTVGCALSQQPQYPFTAIINQENPLADFPAGSLMPFFNWDSSSQTTLAVSS